MKLKKHEKTDLAILHAAKVLFEDKGVDVVTVDEIAQAAGICRTTVFNHFPSIGALLTALSVREVDELIDYCRACGRRGVALIERLFEKLIEDTAAYPHMMTRLANGLMLSKNAGRIAEIENLIEENLPPAGESGLPASDTAQVLMGLYYGQVNHMLVRGLPFCAAEMKRQLFSMLHFILGKRCKPVSDLQERNEEHD